MRVRFREVDFRVRNLLFRKKINYKLTCGATTFVKLQGGNNYCAPETVMKQKICASPNVDYAQPKTCLRGKRNEEEILKLYVKKTKNKIYKINNSVKLGWHCHKDYKWLCTEADAITCNGILVEIKNSKLRLKKDLLQVYIALEIFQLRKAHLVYCTNSANVEIIEVLPNAQYLRENLAEVRKKMSDVYYYLKNPIISNTSMDCGLADVKIFQ